MASPYSWLTQAQAIAALQGRLSNTTSWTSAECWIYLTEALRHWSAMSECWSQDFIVPAANGAWINTGTATGSPRLRSVTDTFLYTQMQYMLLEPPTGGTWTGTTQFDIASLQLALQKRTQEVIQAQACNLIQLAPLASTPGTRRTYFPDTVLEPRRIRFTAVLAQTTATAANGSQSVIVASPVGVSTGMLVAATGIQPGTFVASIAGSVLQVSLPPTASLAGTSIQFSQPVTMTREDTQAFQYFEPGFLQTIGLPQSWAVSAESPLSFDVVDLAPNTPGSYDVLALTSGPTFAPPATSLLGVPDDWSWLPLYGAMADVLGRESEATDRARAEYCLNRYAQGMDLMLKANWMKQAAINDIPVDTPSISEMDNYAPKWQASNANLPTVVQAGIDFVAPTPGIGQSLSITLVGNAPLLDLSGTYVQVARDDFEAILNYSQHLAAFKYGGAEFASTMEMLKDFYRAVGERNKRWLTYGIFADVLSGQGQRQEIVVPR